MNPSKARVWFVVAMCVGLFAAVGCGGGNAPLAGGSGSESSEEPDVTLMVGLNSAEKTEFLHTFENPDASLIEEKVQSLDWTNAQMQPHAGVALAGKGVNVMRLRGTIGMPNEDGLLRLRWIGVEDGQTKHLQTPPLNSAEEAIPVLVSFAGKDDQWRTMVAWEDAPQN